MNTTALVIGLLAVGLLAVMIRIDMVLLKDLADTPDDRLLLMTRKGWAAAIIFMFPIGAILYVTYGKHR